jgi:hypothetical protein
MSFLKSFFRNVKKPWEVGSLAAGPWAPAEAQRLVARRAPQALLPRPLPRRARYAAPRLGSALGAARS